MRLSNFYYEELKEGISQVKGFFPDNFVALQTNRHGGVSETPFNRFNLGIHVGDNPQAVQANRDRLVSVLPNPPVWLEQVHGCEVAVIASSEGARQSIADASLTAETDQVCTVMTADCLPLLIARPATGQCAAVHAGWRGLAAGVIENALGGLLRRCAPRNDEASADPRQSNDGPADDIYIWLGPAIGQNAFEVGPEVREIFVQQSPNFAAAFIESPRQHAHFLADLGQLALLRLKTFESVNPGVALHVAIDTQCVFASPERYFSFRRESRTGRMASLIFRRMAKRPT